MASNEAIIERLLKMNLSDVSVLTDLLSMAIEVEPENKKYAKKIAKTVSDKSLRVCSEKGTMRAYDLYNNSLLYLAQSHEDFDSYMLYTEKDRDPQEMFYLPRRKQLHWLVQQMQKLIDDEVDMLSVSLPPGTGKAQPLYSKVLTPDGFINMGDVKVGQKVISGAGTECEVLGIFPQGKKPIYEITFGDGTKVRCSNDHLWKVYKWVDLDMKDYDVYHDDDYEEDFDPAYFIDYHDVMTLKAIRKNRRDWDIYCIPRLNGGNIYDKANIIKDISYVGDEECQCIYISDPSHLYVTDGYVITHNTTLGEFFLSFVMGHKPNMPNLMSSHSGIMTRMFYDAVLNLIINSEYCWKDVFPDVRIESTNAKEETINLDKWRKFKTLTCRPIRGTLTGATRCEGYLYADDLVSGIEEALSKQRLDKLYGEYTTDLKSRKKNKCKEIHIATRWSVHDVIGRLQRQYDGTGRALFIAIPDIDPKTGKSNFNYDFGVGFNEKYFLDMEESMDDVSYRCLFKNDPVEREGILYHPDELRRYMGGLPDQTPDAIWAVCDTKDTGKDYNFLPVFYQFGDNYYLEDCVFTNIDPGVIDTLNADMLVRHRVQQCQFESNKEGSRTADKVMELVKAKGGRCTITKKYSTQNKDTKIIVNSSWVKEHVLFKDQTEYKPKDDYGQMMSYLCSWTQLGKNTHDDVPDGLAQFAMFVDSTIGTKVKIISRLELGI